MRKTITLLLLATFALATLAATAQERYDYDNGHKYGLLSNLELGAAAVYSQGLASHQHNWGASLLLTKRIGDFWRLRGTAEVNGFAANGFDRLGKATLGVSLDLLPFYAFADYGLCLNPGATSPFGLAADAGAGLQFRLGKAGSLYMEAAVDRTNNGTAWQSNASAKVGYMASLGITEKDRQDVDIDRNMRTGYGELKHENQLLKSEVQKASDAVGQMEATLAKANLLCQQLEEKLANCSTEKKQIEENCQNSGFYPIFFDWGSCQITPAMDGVIADIADEMQRTNNDYYLYGYCSNNGDEWKNKVLSERRANAVYRRLADYYGIDETRLYPVGKGKARADRPTEQKVVVVKIER